VCGLADKDDRCADILPSSKRGSRLEEIRNRIQTLRDEIGEPAEGRPGATAEPSTAGIMDSQKQHEARVARMDEIKEELVKLGRGMK
jgi:hypothetical protein